MAALSLLPSSSLPAEAVLAQTKAWARRSLGFQSVAFPLSRKSYRVLKTEPGDVWEGKDVVGFRKRFRVCSMSATAEKNVPEGRAKPEWTPEIEKIVDGMKWDSNGLVIAVAQSALTGAILMQGFANRDAIAATLSSGRATFFSRSRKSLWTKGETSKNFIAVNNVYIDCDRDSVIYLGTPDGPTCHTGAPTCFFTPIENSVSNENHSAHESSLEPLSAIYALEKTIEERRIESDDKKSWTKKLLKDPTLLCSKIREEADEFCRTLEENEGKERAASEMADLLYHSMVLMNLQGVKVEDVMSVLHSRFSISGIQEKLNRSKN